MGHSTTGSRLGLQQGAQAGKRVRCQTSNYKEGLEQSEHQSQNAPSGGFGEPPKTDVIRRMNVDLPQPANSVFSCEP